MKRFVKDSRKCLNLSNFLDFSWSVIDIFVDSKRFSAGLVFLPRPEQDRRIAEKIFYPDYHCTMQEYDIALVKVDKPVELVGNQISVISLPCMKENPGRKTDMELIYN